MIWEVAALIVPWLFCSACVFALLRNRPEWLLSLVPMGLAFGGFNFYALGTIWFPIKIVCAFALLYCLLHPIWIRLLRFQRFNAWWLLTATVVFGVGVSFLVEPAIDLGPGGGLQGARLRPFVQAFSYVSYLSLIPLSLICLRVKQSFKFFLDSYGAAGAVSVIGCIWQLVAIASGTAFMPILRITGRHNEVAAFSEGSTRIYRLYSFAGEPKSLAALMLPIAIAALIASTVSGRGERPWWSFPAISWAFLVVTVLTFSSAALVALGAVAVVGIALLGPHVVKLGKLLIVGGVVSLSLPVLTSMISTSKDIFVWQIIRGRTIDRIQTTRNELPETQALQYLFYQHIDLLPFGVGLGMYNFHLPNMIWSGGVNNINSGWVTFLMDFGLLGTVVWLVALGSLLIRSLASLKGQSTSTSVFVLPAIGGLLAAMMMHGGWNVTPLLTLWAGVLLSPALSTPSHRSHN